MKRLIIIFCAVVFFSSCGNDTLELVEETVLLEDTTLTEQTAEFKAINDLLKTDINNPALYLRRTKLIKRSK